MTKKKNYLPEINCGDKHSLSLSTKLTLPMNTCLYIVAIAYLVGSVRPCVHARIAPAIHQCHHHLIACASVRASSGCFEHWL